MNGFGLFGDLVGNFHFLRPLWLLGLLPLLALALLAGRRGSRFWSRHIDPTFLCHLLLDSGGPVRRRLQQGVLAGAWIAAVLALAGPSWDQEEVHLQKVAAPLIVVLDQSLSMYARDIQPNRYEAARYRILGLLRGRQEGQSALIAYSRSAHVVVPLTEDRATFANLLKVLEPSLMPSYGSVPVPAMEQALLMLDQAGSSSGQVLWFTDGASKAALARIASIFSASPHRLTIILTGTEADRPVPLPGGTLLRERSGAPVSASLDRKSFSQAFGPLSSVRILDWGDLDQSLIAELAADASSDSQVDERLSKNTRWRDRGHWLLPPLLLAVLLAFARGQLAVFLLASLLPLSLAGRAEAAWNDWWKSADQRGQDAFHQQEFARAAELFEGDAWRAASLYRQGEYNQALTVYKWIDDPYNQGNALAHLGRFQEAIAAYELALERDSENEDAAYNLELLKRMLRQQQQRQQGQNGGEGEGQQGEGEENQASSGGGGGDEQFLEGPGGRRQAEEEDGGQQQQAQQGAAGEQESSSQAGRDEHDQNGGVEEGMAEIEEQEQRQGEESEAEKALLQRSAEAIASEERSMRLQQWLNQLADDPSLLLKRKFQYQYSRRQDRSGGAAAEDGKW